MSALSPHLILTLAAALLLLTTATAQVDTAGLAVDGVAPTNYGGKRCYTLIDGCDTCSRYMFPRIDGKIYGDGAKLATFNGGKYWKINTCQICKIGWSLFGDGDFYKFTKFPKYCIPPQECQGDPPQPMYSKGFMCSDKKINATCTADCIDGYTGGYTATCTSTKLGTEWKVTGLCRKVPGGKKCQPPKPATRPNGKPFDCQGNAVGNTCTADCEPLATGGYKAECKFPMGNPKRRPIWMVSGDCTVSPPPTKQNCTPPPAMQPNGKPFDNCGVTPGDFCFTGCSNGFLGGYVAECKYDAMTKTSDYVYNGTCVPVPTDKCPATPPDPTPTDPYFEKFGPCTDVTVPAVCRGTCNSSSTGSYVAVCLPSPPMGSPTWFVRGYCMPNKPTMPTCTLPPPAPSKYPSERVTPCDSGSAAVGSVCISKCTVGVGGFLQVCTPAEDGTADWKTFGQCCTSGLTCLV